MKQILTIPSVIENKEKYYLTGNHYLSLSDINKEGTIKNISYLLSSTKSLVELKGNLKPIISIDNKNIVLSFLKYSHDFIPLFSYGDDLINISYEIIPIENKKGALLKFSVESKEKKKINIGFSLSDYEAYKAIFHEYKMNSIIKPIYYDWTKSLIYFIDNDYNYGGFGISSNEDMKYEINEKSSFINIEDEICGIKEYNFFLVVASTIDEVGLNLMDLRRREQSLSLDQYEILDKRHVTLKEKELEDYANFNRNFSYYYSLGYTIDNNDLSMITSKSPKYYVSSAYWSRDTFLWSFRNTLSINKNLARDMINKALSFKENLGIHALYFDGNVLYPGFELDELVSIVIAIEEYENKTGEKLNLDLSFIKSELDRWFSKEEGLYSTELDSSDDPVLYKFNTYSNILVFKTLNYLGYKEEALELKKNILNKCVVKKDNKDILSYSYEASKNEIYDNPPGSLSLAGFYGFLDKEDPLFINTINYIYSSSNEYYYASNKLFGCGCLHVKYPWVISLINYMYSFKDKSKAIEALKIISKKYMITMESFDLESGELNTGDAFATMAGFIAEGIIDND